MFHHLKYFALLISLRQTALGACTNHACSGCQTGSSTKCQDCSSVYNRIQNGDDCPCMPGYYDQNIPYCDQCHVTCLTCRGPASTDCYTCDANLYRTLQNTVSITCLCKWVYDTHYKQYFCSTGDAGNPGTYYYCSTCADTFSASASNYCDDNTKKQWNGNFCGCQPNYYDSFSINGVYNCQTCHPNCLTCNNPNYNGCLSCSATNFRTLSQSTCICQDGYADTGNAACTTCHFSCLTCTNPSNSGCSSCNQANFRYGYYTNCYCQQGYFDPGSAICGACHVSCQTCTSNLNTACQSCNSANLRTLQQSSCPCNSGYFDNGNALCAACHFSCQTCTDATSTHCSSCNAQSLRTFNSSNNQCLCNPGSFDNGFALCAACHFSCQACTNALSTSCTSCNATNNRTIFSNSNNKTCLCNPGTVDNGTAVCAACDYSCQTCTQVFNTNCSQCNATNFRALSLNTCLCKGGYFNNGFSRCASCNLSCLTCTGATNISCLSCDSINYRILSKSSCLCLPGYFENGAAICGTCDISCQNCTNGTSSSCISCDSTSLRSFFNNSCPCNQGYFDDGNAMCKACHFSCQSGINALSTGCTSCNATNFRNQSNSRCLCLPGYFDNEKDTICGACDLSCQTCTQGINTTCSTCNSSNFRSFIMHTCRCDNGYYNNGSAICDACDHSCYTCNGPLNTNCLSCDETNLRFFYGSNNTCTCTSMYYDNGIPMCSLICDVSCQTCSDYTINGCLSCNGSFPYYRSITDQYTCQCIEGYYGSSSGTCIPINCTISQYFDQLRQQCAACHLSCQSCSGPFSQQCLSCNSSSLRTLKNAQCNCPSDYFAQNQKVICTQFCQAGQYQTGFQCLSCHPICSKCKGGSPLDCTACKLANYDELNTNQNSQMYYQNSPIKLNLNIKSYICQNKSSKQVSVAQNDSSVVVLLSATNINTNTEDFIQSYSGFNILLPKQTFLSGEKYQIQIKLIQPNERILQSQQQMSNQKFNTSFILQIMSAAKIITLAGGNRVVSNSQNFRIECQIFDFNHQDTPIFDFSSYNFSWSCNPITYNVSCLDNKGLILDTSSINQFLAINGTDLTPYNSYQFNVVIYDIKGRIKYNSSVIYQVVDHNLPTLQVIFDPNILALPVNLNLEQKFQFVYPLPINPDDLFFSANLLYDFDLVSTIIYHYSTVNFRIWDYYTGFTNTCGTKLYFNGQVYNPKFLLPSLFTITMNVNIPPQMCEISVSPGQGIELIDLFLIQVQNCISATFDFNYRFGYYQSQMDYDHDTYQQSLARGSIQTSFQASNQLITYLPKCKNGSEIILVISVQDSIGGIQNYTKNINVNPIQFMNETIIVGILNNITDLASQLRYLQVISASLMDSNQSFPIITPVMDQILVKANNTTLSHEQQNQLLQIQAFTSSQTTDLGSLIQSQKSTSQNVIQQIKNSLIFTKANPSSILNQQTNDILINLNTILDSQHVLGTIILENLNQQQNSSLDKNSTQTQIINQQNQQVMDLLNQTRLIQIQQMTPNEGTKILKSEHGFSAVALTTKKFLGELLGKDIIDDNQNNFFSQSTQVDKNNYYTFSYLQYSENPYSSDQSFPYYDQGYPATDLQITQQSKSVISSHALQNSPNIKPTQYLPFSIDQNGFHQPIVNKSQVCISKVQLVGWTAQECQTIITQGRLSCQCNTINPTTVVVDYKQLFNGSYSGIFSTSTINGIKSFHWEQTSLIWIIVMVTIIYLVSLPLGWRKDKFDRINKSKSQLQLKDESPISDIVYKQSSKINPPDIQSQKVIEDIIIGDNKNSIILIGEIEEIKSDIDELPKESNDNEDEYQDCIKKEQSPHNRDWIVQNQKNQFKQDDNEHNLVLSPINGIYLDILESASIRQSSVSLYISQMSELEKLEKSKKQNITFPQYFLMNQNFTNVYYSYEQLNRPVRSSLVFLCLISNLAISVFFGSTFQIVKSIILSILSSIATIITISTLKILLSAKSLVLNIIGLIFFISLTGFLIFVILAIVSQTESIKQTNIWSLQYTIQIGYDSTIGSIAPLLIKYKFFR